MQDTFDLEPMISRLFQKLQFNERLPDGGYTTTTSADHCLEKCQCRAAASHEGSFIAQIAHSERSDRIVSHSPQRGKNRIQIAFSFD